VDLKNQNMMHIIKWIAKQLMGHLTQPEESAWWIIEAITGEKKSHFITHGTISLTVEQEEILRDWLEAITKNNKPLQYLIGSVPFNSLEILVEPPVLIPRPETEEWCCYLIDQLEPLRDKRLVIIDVCTGSGCIALALAKALPKAMVYGTDLSYHALTLARKNAIHNKITNVTFLHSNLLDAISHEFSCDMIVANPPYIAESEWNSLDVSVKRWEDKSALLAESNGLALIERIIKTAPKYIRHNEHMKRCGVAQVTIEIGYQQGDAVMQLMRENHYSNVSVRKDLECKDRVVCGRVT